MKTYIGPVNLQYAKLVEKTLKKKLRSAIADYMMSEGCSCCVGANHHIHEVAIAKLLNVPKYKDGSGYDFSKYRTQKMKWG